MMAEQGPVEVQHAARAFNAMQTRIRDHLQERADPRGNFPRSPDADYAHEAATGNGRPPELRDKLCRISTI
jgi:hypothetical protein